MAIESVGECVDFIEGFVRVGAKHISICDLMDVKELLWVEETLKTYGSKLYPTSRSRVGNRKHKCEASSTAS